MKRKILYYFTFSQKLKKTCEQRIASFDKFDIKKNLHFQKTSNIEVFFGIENIILKNNPYNVMKKIILYYFTFSQKS